MTQDQCVDRLFDLMVRAGLVEPHDMIAPVLALANELLMNTEPLQQINRSPNRWTPPLHPPEL